MIISINITDHRPLPEFWVKDFAHYLPLHDIKPTTDGLIFYLYHSLVIHANVFGNFLCLDHKLLLIVSANCLCLDLLRHTRKSINMRMARLGQALINKNYVFKMKN